MRLLNFSVADRRSFGVLTENGVVDLGVRLNAPVDDLTSFVRANLMASGRALASAAQADYRLDEVKILAPAGRTRYFCIGVNYPERNEEYRDGSERPRYPSIFMRTHTSFVAHGESVVRPRESEQLDYEGEIVLIMGRGGRRIPESEALGHVLGYTLSLIHI